MTSRLLSELLILFLLTLSTSRFLFIHKVQSDSLSIVPTVALILAVLNVFAWEINLTEVVILVLSFLVWMWNVRAVLRFLSGLVIDHFGFWSIFISSVNLLLCIAGFVFVLYFKPADVNLKKYNVQRITESYGGNFKDGFHEIKNPFERKSAYFETFSLKEKKVSADEKKLLKDEELSLKENAAPADEDSEFSGENAFQTEENLNLIDEIASSTDKTETLTARTNGSADKTDSSSNENPDSTPENAISEQENAVSINENTGSTENTAQSRKIIVFLPPKTASAETYLPALVKLAFNGYTVVTGSFYSGDLKWFNDSRDWKILREHAFIYMKQQDKKNNTVTYESCFRTHKRDYKKELDALIKYASPQENDSVFIACDEDSALAVEEYYRENSSKLLGFYDLASVPGYTTPGYGPVEQSNPLLAANFNLKKDKSLYMASHIAQCLEENIQEWTVLKQRQEALTSEETGNSLDDSFAF